MKKIILLVAVIVFAGFGVFLLVKNKSATIAKPYDQQMWREVKSFVFDIEEDSVPYSFYLLESIKPTGSTGLGDSMFDVRTLIIRDGKTIYDYLPGVSMPDLLENGVINSNKYYIDNTFELADLTGDRKLDLVFHSGYVGATDDVVVTHILVYDATSKSYIESKNSEFYNSFNHEMTMLRDRTIVVVAPEPSTAACRTCSQNFIYTLYTWKTDSFVPIQKFISTKSFEGAREALENDVDHDAGGVLKKSLKQYLK